MARQSHAQAARQLGTRTGRSSLLAGLDDGVEVCHLLGSQPVRDFRTKLKKKKRNIITEIIREMLSVVHFNRRCRSAGFRAVEQGGTR